MGNGIGVSMWCGEWYRCEYVVYVCVVCVWNGIGVGNGIGVSMCGEWYRCEYVWVYGVV